MITAYVFNRYRVNGQAEVSFEYVQERVYMATVYGDTPLVYRVLDRDDNLMTIIALISFEGHGIVAGCYELWQSREEYEATRPKCGCGDC